jgi:hypothetical protein
MKKYDFTEKDIENFGSNVFDESGDKIFKVMQEVNNSPLQITDEQNTRFQKVYDSIAINITIGNQTIAIPNTADNIESILSAIKECREQTIEL